MACWREKGCVSFVWRKERGKGIRKAGKGESEESEWAGKGDSKKTVSSVSWEQQGKAREEREKSVAGKLGDRRNSQRNGVSRKSAAARQKHPASKSMAPTLFVMEQ